MDTQSIGNYIREKRMKNGWTQEQLAEKLEVASKTVSNWENGNFSSIKNENLDKLSKVFQVSVGEIYLGKDMVGLDEESKQILSQEIRNLNEKVDNVQTITIKVEDRGLVSLELGANACGLSFIAIALALAGLVDFTQIPIMSVVFLTLLVLGISFLFCGKKVVSEITKQNEKVRNQPKK